MRKLFTLFFVLSLACSVFADTYYYDGTLVYRLAVMGTDRYAYVCNPREYTGSTPVTPYTGNIAIPDSISTSEEGIDAYEVRYIKQGAFKNSTITSIILPRFIQSIEDSAFYSCRKLTSVRMMIGCTGLNSISQFAFYKCDKMTNCILKFNNAIIFKNAFRYCEALTTINLNNVALIDEGVFSYCTKLENVISFNNENITTLPKSLFYNCSSLKNINIPDNVTKIDPSTFNGCTSLKVVNINKCIADIRGSYFVGCDSLESFEVDSNNTRYKGSDYLFDKATNTLVVGTTYGFLNDHLFDPTHDEIETIGDSAYYGRKITWIRLPLTLQSIGAYAFANTSLKVIYIPDNVESIGIYAFSGSPLTKAIIGAKVNNMYYSFDNCSNFTNLVLTTNSTTPIDAIFDSNNITVEMDSSLISHYKTKANWKYLNLVESDEFYKGFYYYLDNNKAIINSLIEYDPRCYYSLFKNDTIVIPEYISYQGIKYPVTKIDGLTFAQSKYFSTKNNIVLQIPSTMKEIGSQAFIYNNLNKVIFNNGLERIGDYAFWKSRNLEEFNIPNTVTEIGAYAFGYAAIKEVNIPDNIDTIRDETFFQCHNLEKIILGKNIKSIGESNFNSPKLKTIICKSLTPAIFTTPVFEANFSDVIKDSARLVVPEVALTDYQNAPVWQEFLDIQGSTDLNPTAVEGAVIENLWVENGTVHYEGEFRIYDIVGRDVTNLNGNLNGIYIIRTKDAVQKVSITK